MPRQIRCQIEIEATAQRVWEALLDFTAYPQWNEFIRRIEGEAIMGERLRVMIQPPGSRPVRFSPRLLAVDAPKRLCWMGHLWMPGLFDGEHSFSIEPLSEGRVCLVQEERFSGLLSPLIWPLIAKSTRRGFMLMNAALKGRLENYGSDV